MLNDPRLNQTIVWFESYKTQEQLTGNLDLMKTLKIMQNYRQ